MAGVVALSLLTLVTSAQAKLLSVKVRSANFRDGPSMTAEILFTADRYFPVRVLKHKRGWVEVEDFERERAWVAARLLGRLDTAIVKVQVGNVRAGPSIHHGVVGKIHYGEAFRIKKRKGRWLKLASSDAIIGWVRDDLTWGDERS